MALSHVTPAVLTASFVLVACDARSSDKITHNSEPVRFAPAGAPDPLACRSDEECVPGPVVDPENGCCDTGASLDVFGKGYIEWRAGWVRDNCSAVTCAPQPSPAQPAPCATQGRCTKGRCQNLCAEPSGPAEGASVERAILPTDVARLVGLSEEPKAWPPTPGELDGADRLLTTCLPTLAPSPAYQADKVPEIVAALGEYRRQVVPFRGQQGQRLLWFNLFLDRSGDHHPRWRSEYVSVRGGGHGYFSIVIDVDARSCSDLRINSPR